MLGVAAVAHGSFADVLAVCGRLGWPALSPQCESYFGCEISLCGAFALALRIEWHAQSMPTPHSSGLGCGGRVWLTAGRTRAAAVL